MSPMNLLTTGKTATKMNSTNLYSTTSQIILRADPNDPRSWEDLYRLVPYLRNTLCCVVCSNLLMVPLTPARGQCQHHLCEKCKGGRKKIKPACENCKDCEEYIVNKSLRIVMQCYKSMCLFLMHHSPIFKCIKAQASQPDSGLEEAATSLIQIIQEGAVFDDSYKSQGGLPKSAYSILPCIYTNTLPKAVYSVSPCIYKNITNNTSNSAVTVSQVQPTIEPKAETSKTQNFRPTMYSIHPGTGNKITIKRKPKETTSAIRNVNIRKDTTEKPHFKKPSTKPKKGCRCGNATATPGKLTCCGQRCPCYVDSKACIDCKCRGCNNPHTPDGNKVMPYMTKQQMDVPKLVMPHMTEMQLQQIQILQPSAAASNVPPQSTVPVQPEPPTAMIAQDPNLGVKLEGLELDSPFFAATEPLNQQFKAFKCEYLLNGYDPLQSLMTSDLLPYGFNDEDEDPEITVV